MLARLTLISAALMAGFFALTMVLPLTTVGDPAYDIVMLRTRWYGQFFVYLPHLLAVVGAGVMALRGRNVWALASAVLSVLAFWVIATEEGRFIQYGDLKMSHDAAMPLLMLSKLASSGFAVAAVLTLWSGHARR